jgi:glycosidase
MNLLLLTLPGTPTTYYGEEIGMQEINVTYEDTQDPWGKNVGPVSKHAVFSFNIHFSAKYFTA